MVQILKKDLPILSIKSLPLSFTMPRYHLFALSSINFSLLLENSEVNLSVLVNNTIPYLLITPEQVFLYTLIDPEYASSLSKRKFPTLRKTWRETWTLVLIAGGEMERNLNPSFDCRGRDGEKLEP